MAEPAASRPPSRLLVVDDEPDVRLVVRTLVSDGDWHVEEASSGEEALERLERNEFDVVVLDHRMPGMTGMDVARTLADRGFSTPIIIYSAYLSDELEAEAGELGLPTVDKADPIGLVSRLHELVGR